MKPGQFVFYICHGVVCPQQLNHDDTCNLPGIGFFRIKDSPYRLVLQS